MPHDRREAPPASRLRRASVLLASALLLVIAACGPSGPTGSPPAQPSVPAASPSAAGGSPAPSVGPSQDASAIYATIEQQVIAIRQLQPRTPVTPTVLDDAGIKKLTADSFAKDNPPAIVAANERIMKALGLLPADASLSDLYVKLLGSQVAGLYSPDDKKLYVVSRSGALGPIEKTTFSHEYTHALQDQNFDLGTLHLDEIGQGDRSFGRLALVEGDATLSMSYWQIQHLSQAELGQLINGAGSDDSTKQLLAMPPILRESLLFPYTQGLAFVQGLQGQGGWAAVNAAFAKPPASTEQIIHPEKYAAGELPLAVELPKDLASRLGSGWTIDLEDSFGEFQMAIWLRQSKALSTVEANAAAAGWGGDRIAVADGPNGSWAVILRTLWDTPEDASAFEAAAAPLAGTLANPAAVMIGAGGVERWLVVGSDDAALSRAAGALGLAG